MKTVRLSELLTPAGARAGQRSDLPVYSVTKHAGFVPSLEYFKKQVFSREVSGYKMVEPGDFAYATIHLDEGSIGIAPERALISPMYTAFSVDRERVDPSYLLRFLKSPLAIAQYPQLGRGAVHRRMAISLTALGSLEITIPPLGEQRRTVALLDATDTLLARHRAMQLGLRKLTLSVFRRMFDGVASTELSELVEEFRYGTSNKSGPRGYPTLRIPNILGGAVNVSETKLVQVSDPELKRLSLREGDLLFVRTNGNPDNVGRSAVFSRPQGASADYGDRPWIYASYLIRARLTGRVLPAFVATYLATEAGRRQLRERSRTSAGQYNINAESLASIQVPLPPLADQQTFAARAGAIAAQRLLVERALAKDEELFASLQHRAFSGML